MPDNKFKILYFLGPSKSGKTTSIEHIIGALAIEGIACATVKFIHHPNLHVDPVGKDSSRHRNAGALYSINFAPKETAIMISKTERETIDDAVKIISSSQGFLPSVDILMCESLNSPPPHSLVFLSANDDQEIVSYMKNIPECEVLAIIGNITNSKPDESNFKNIPFYSALITKDLNKLVFIIKEKLLN